MKKKRSQIYGPSILSRGGKRRVRAGSRRIKDFADSLELLMANCRWGEFDDELFRIVLRSIRNEAEQTLESYERRDEQQHQTHPPRKGGNA